MLSTGECAKRAPKIGSYFYAEYEGQTVVVLRVKRDAEFYINGYGNLKFHVENNWFRSKVSKSVQAAMAEAFANFPKK
jgi:hypothetical protein